MIIGLDHLNIRTHQLDVLMDWYARMLGFQSGPRPDFSFPGAWMYCGDQPLVHLVGVDKEPGADPHDLKLEHGAFRAAGFTAFVDRFKQAGERYEITPVPGFPIVQVNVWDPDGNHLHIDFDAAEVPESALKG
jgi:catechol 2,3-dioxygenase-like lactoylglutathione lyase family enzyme